MVWRLYIYTRTIWRKATKNSRNTLRPTTVCVHATTRQILKSALLVFRFIEFKMLMVFNYNAFSVGIVGNSI